MTLDDKILAVLEKRKGEKLIAEDIRKELEAEYGPNRFFGATLNKLRKTGSIKGEKKYDPDRGYAQWRYYL